MSPLLGYGNGYSAGVQPDYASRYFRTLPKKKMLFRNFKSFHLLEKIIFSDLGQGLPTANGKSGMKWNLWDGIYIE